MEIKDPIALAEKVVSEEEIGGEIIISQGPNIVRATPIVRVITITSNGEERTKREISKIRIITGTEVDTVSIEVAKAIHLLSHKLFS